jgi:pimeloyl-ACP methyl ester carboxylesterase
MVDDLKEFISDLKFDQINLIGHSLGGKTAMHFALENSILINKLVVLDIGIKSYPQRHDYIFDALCGMDLSQFSSRNEIDQHLSESIHSFPIRQFLMKNIHRDTDKKFSWKMNLPVIRDHYQILADGVRSSQKFRQPTLFIRGANSSYIMQEDMTEITKLFPAAELSTIPGASHWLHAEKPYELLKLVKAFLEVK